MISKIKMTKENKRTSTSSKFPDLRPCKVTIVQSDHSGCICQGEPVTCPVDWKCLTQGEEDNNTIEHRGLGLTSRRLRIDTSNTGKTLNSKTDKEPAWVIIFGIWNIKILITQILAKCQSFNPDTKICNGVFNYYVSIILDRPPLSQRCQHRLKPPTP